MDRLHETLDLLKMAATKHREVAVAFSGGKDSLVVMDLAVRSFERVHPFFMYFVPGLEVCETALEYGRQRWGCKIRQYPHWILTRLLRDEVFCSVPDAETIGKMNVNDVYNLARHDTGAQLVVTGAKRADSLWRRRQLAIGSDGERMLYPCVGWNKYDVLAYLRLQSIPLPSSSGKAATGIDLSTPSLLWLHDQHPADFRKICEVFPYAEAVIARRRFFGIAG